MSPYQWIKKKLKIWTVYHISIITTNLSNRQTKTDTDNMGRSKTNRSRGTPAPNEWGIAINHKGSISYRQTQNHLNQHRALYSQMSFTDEGNQRFTDAEFNDLMAEDKALCAYLDELEVSKIVSDLPVDTSDIYEVGDDIFQSDVYVQCDQCFGGVLPVPKMTPTTDICHCEESVTLIEAPKTGVFDKGALWCLHVDCLDTTNCHNSHQDLAFHMCHEHDVTDYSPGILRVPVLTLVN